MRVLVAVVGWIVDSLIVGVLGAVVSNDSALDLVVVVAAAALLLLADS